MCHNIQHNYTYSCTLYLILQRCNSPAIICKRKGANQCCGRTYVCYSHTHWFTFILKTLSAEDCHGKRSMTCNWRTVEATWFSINTCPCSTTEVILLIARAACAFVSCGFSSYSAWWRSLTRRLHNRFKNCIMVLLHQADSLSSQVWKKQEAAVEAYGLKAAGDFYMLHAPNQCLFYHRNIEISNRVPKCIFTNLSHSNTGAQFSKTQNYTSGSHFCPH